MSQIKAKIGKPSYNLASFRNDLHLLWNNARTYNQEGSWVFNAAEDMQEAFDKMWDDEVPQFLASQAAGAENSVGETSAGASGSSTPMFKPVGDKTIAPKIRISMGKKKIEAAMDGDESMDGGEDDDY